ncbi:hypothetical protein [Thiobacillus sp.]
MRLNIFEGARRIAMLIGGVWAIGCISYAIFNEPYVVLSYEVSSLGAKPELVENCSPDSASEYIAYVPGSDASIDLCFAASRADNGMMLIPYAPAADGKVWMAEEYSTEVRNYTRSVRQSFQLDTVGIKAAGEKRSAARREQWADAAKALFLGLIAGWILVVAIGWIVRGFLGIAHGRDARPSEQPSTAAITGK